MIDYVFWGTILVLVLTLLFYGIFTAFAYYYHERRTSYVVVPMLYTFQFFLVTFLVVALLVIILQYLPELLAAINA